MILFNIPFTEVFDFYNGKAIRSDDHGDIPIFGSNGIIGFTKKALYSDAIILGRVGAYCGSVMRCKGEFWASDNTIVVQPKEFVADTNYCYYLLKNLKLNNYAGGAAQPLITQTTLKQIVIKIHNIDDQRRIANILSAYDDLIENNQKQIKLLEEAAMRLYKEWFVNLRFPGYETTNIVDGVPEGWNKCKLGDVIEFDPNVKLEKGTIKKSVPMAALSTNSMIIDTADMSETTQNAGSKFCFEDTLLARITPCLENGKTAFVSFLDDYEKAVGSTEFIVMRSRKLNPYLVYCIARSDYFRGIAINSMSGADGRQRVKADKLKSIEYILPDNGMIELIGQYLKPMFRQVHILNEQCQEARIARDKLLAKLMSGEIEV